MVPDSFQCYQLHLENLVVLKQRYILMKGCVITSETNDMYKTYEKHMFTVQNRI